MNNEHSSPLSLTVTAGPGVVDAEVAAAQTVAGGEARRRKLDLRRRADEVVDVETGPSTLVGRVAVADASHHLTANRDGAWNVLELMTYTVCSIVNTISRPISCTSSS